MDLGLRVLEPMARQKGKDDIDPCRMKPAGDRADEVRAVAEAVHEDDRVGRLAAVVQDHRIVAVAADRRRALAVSAWPQTGWVVVSTCTVVA